MKQVNPVPFVLLLIVGIGNLIRFSRDVRTVDAVGHIPLQPRRVRWRYLVGHPEFYPRFGFRPASQFGVLCEWPVPDDVFMMMVLNESRMAGVTGLAKYRSEFSTIG